VTPAIAMVVGCLTFAAAYVLLTTRRRLAIHRQLGHYVGAATVSRRPSIGSGRVADLFQDALAKLHLQGPITLRLERAGLETSAGAFTAMVLVAGGALSVLVLVVSGIGAALLVAAAVPAVTWIALTVLASRRTRSFDEQLPEILDMLSSSLKAGHSFQHALQNLASDISEPAGAEFRRVVAEVHLGRPLETALAELGDRIRSEDLMFVLDAITVQRQVGGSLADLFALVGDTVRQRDQFRRKLRAITGMVRASAKVLTALPIVTALMLTLVNRHYMAPLWTTGTGHVLLLITATMVGLGAFALRRVGAVKS
jgi:tight adherence protein B